MREAFDPEVKRWSIPGVDDAHFITLKASDYDKLLALYREAKIQADAHEDCFGG